MSEKRKLELARRHASMLGAMKDQEWRRVTHTTGTQTQERMMRYEALAHAEALAQAEVRSLEA